MITCDALAYKVIDLNGFKITASGIIFSFSYLLSTISTEVYGYKLGGRTVWIVMLCQAVFVILISDSCLNLLYFPPGVNQTLHTHPSMRVGMVIRGKGECITPNGTIPLIAGRVFIIPADGEHGFRTRDSEMSVVAYHPDSDFGPTHDVHPMINRTIINGMPANMIDEIRTKALPMPSADVQKENEAVLP